MATPVLFGLVLAGGSSRRMQRDKALLDYHGKPQLHWTFDLVSSVCDATFISVRPDQCDEPTRAPLPQIVDRRPGIGPIAGISTAQAQHPKAAWLVVACDLPFLDEATLLHLIGHRDPQRIATAYRSAHDGLPEPLCAIWEPASREPLLGYIDAGRHCPRKFLIEAHTLLLDLPHTQALDNVNTPPELAAAHSALGAADSLAHAARDLSPGRDETDGSRRMIHVQYYALLREQAGRSEESLETSARTPADLYRELQARHPFKLTTTQLKVAINSEFADWQASLNDGDTVVFIPPVAGG